MPDTAQGIILQHIRYRDKKSILKIYTLQHGLQSYAVNVGHSKSSKIRAAHVAALNQVEFIEHSRKLREVQVITEIRLTYIYENLFTDMVKSCLASFINEVLLKCLHDHQPNEELFFFLSVKLKSLDQSTKNVANYHLQFLLELADYMGFHPQNNYSEKNCLFDLQEGIFTSTPPEHVFFADTETSEYLSRLMKSREQRTDFTCDAKVRSALLEILLLFYKLHVPGFGELRSLPVLRELMA